MCHWLLHRHYHHYPLHPLLRRNRWIALLPPLSTNRSFNDGTVNARYHPLRCSMTALRHRHHLSSRPLHLHRRCLLWCFPHPRRLRLRSHRRLLHRRRVSRGVVPCGTVQGSKALAALGELMFLRRHRWHWLPLLLHHHPPRHRHLPRRHLLSSHPSWCRSRIDSLHLNCLSCLRC